MSTLKVKYAWLEILLESHGITGSDISRGTSISGVSDSDSHRVRSRMDMTSSGGSAHA